MRPALGSIPKRPGREHASMVRDRNVQAGPVLRQSTRTRDTRRNDFIGLLSSVTSRQHAQERVQEPSAGRGARNCRFCGAPLGLVMVDLGMSPLCESFLTADQLDQMEPFYPLRAMVCEECYLVQLGEYVPPEDIFTEYAYFSSFSASWLEHARGYAESAIERLGLDAGSLVVELGSNDGYLLRNFVAHGVPVLGIEPARNVAAAAQAAGVPTLPVFFGRDTAVQLVGEYGAADLIVVNNVLAQIPALNDFVAGIALLLADDGLLTVEVPHLLRLLEHGEFDTIYHEHFSYFSLGTAIRILDRHGLTVVDVEELRSHGGSIRIHARHAGPAAVASAAVARVLTEEADAGMTDPGTYERFGDRVANVKSDLLEFLIAQRRDGRTVAGYGAPGKANTLLNYCGIRTDLLPFTVDRNPYKHGRFTPGTHIPIRPAEYIEHARPDFVWILPWNLKEEIVGQLDFIRSWGGRFVVAIPTLSVIE